MKKKIFCTIFLSSCFLLLFSQHLCISLASSYTDYFNFSGEDLINLYDIFMDNSISDLNTYETTNSGNIETLWNSGENLLKNEFTIEELNVVADNLNYFMYDCWILSGDGYGWNSEDQTNLLNDANLFVSVAPGQQVNSVSGKNIVFAFTPQINVDLYLNETISAGTSSYIVSKNFYNKSGDNTITQETWQTSFTIILEIKPDKTATSYYRKNSTNYSKYPFYEFYRRGLMYPYDNKIFYYNGILSTFRQNKNWTLNQIYVRTPQTNNMYRQASLGYWYSLDTKESSSGEPVTPTPVPTSPGSGEGGGITKEELTSGMIDANNQYWGTSGELTGEEQEQTIENAINGLIEDTSGELTQNQAFQQLEQIENGFILFFDKNHDENWYDLKFTWEDIGLDLYDLGDRYFISGDTLNISKMCRDIPILGVIQTTIRTIFNFSICVMLIKQIWNLILATLGIDNPYLYEDPEEEHVNFGINENTGTMTRTIQRGKIRRWKSI